MQRRRRRGPLWAAPLTVWLGSVLNRRLSSSAFNKVIYVLLAVSGVYLVYSNIVGRMQGT